MGSLCMARHVHVWYEAGCRYSHQRGACVFGSGSGFAVVHGRNESRRAVYVMWAVGTVRAHAALVCPGALWRARKLFRRPGVCLMAVELVGKPRCGACIGGVGPWYWYVHSSWPLAKVYVCARYLGQAAKLTQSARGARRSSFGLTQSARSDPTEGSRPLPGLNMPHSRMSPPPPMPFYVAAAAGATVAGVAVAAASAAAIAAVASPAVAAVVVTSEVRPAPPRPAPLLLPPAQSLPARPLPAPSSPPPLPPPTRPRPPLRRRCSLNHLR